MKVTWPGACGGAFMIMLSVIHAQSDGVPGRNVQAGARPPDEVATKLMAVPIYNFAVHNIAFSPNGKTLATGDGEGNVRLWEVETGKLAAKVAAHTNWAFSVAWSKDGSRFATGGADSLVKWFSAEDPSKPLMVFRGHQKDAHAVVVSSDMKQVISAGDDRNIIVWDVKSGKPKRQWEAHSLQIPALTMSPGDRLLASGSRDRTIRLWDWRSGELKDTLIGHTEDVMAVRFSPDGKKLASASYDSTIRLWDVPTGKALRIYQGHTNRAFSVSFSPDGKRLASAGDSTVWIHEVETGRALKVLQPGGSVTTEGKPLPEILSSVAYSPDGRRIAAASTTGATYLFDSETGAFIRRFVDPAAANP